MSEFADQIGAMFGMVEAAFEAAGVTPGRPIATYAMAGDQMDVVVGFELAEGDVPELEVVELEPVQAVVAQHRGDLSGIQSSWKSMHDWVVANDVQFGGPCREVYLSSGDPEWVIDLEQPINYGLAESSVDQVLRDAGSGRIRERDRATREVAADQDRR